MEDLERIVTRLREAWPEVETWVRGDSTFAREEIMLWCEEQTGVHYVLGFAPKIRSWQG